MRPLSRFGLLGLSLLVLAAHAADSALIVATDLLKLKQIEAPALSPDGKSVVYVLRSIEPKPDLPAEGSAKAGAKDDWTYQTHLWLAATDGRTPPRRLTFGPANDSAPAWSPAGDRIAFVRAAEKEKPQVRVLPLSGGEAVTITKLDAGATTPRWSPDGTRLLVTSALTSAQARDALEKAGAPAKPAWNFEQPGRTANDVKNYALKKKPGENGQADPALANGALAKADGSLAERREWLAKNEADGNPRALTRLNFLDERDINPEQTFNHLVVQEARDGAPATDLTPGYVSFAGGEWMADGRAVVCTGPRKLDEHPDRSESTSLYLADAAGLGVKLFVATPDFSLANPKPSPDGRQVALTATRGDTFSYAQAAVAIVPATGGAPRLLTEKLDRNAGSLQWSDDSAAIYFVAPTNGGFPLYRVNAATGVTDRLSPRLDTGVRAYDVTGNTLVQVLTTPTNPNELYVSTTEARTASPLTNHNTAWLAGKKLAVYEPHTLTNSAGAAVEFWTMKPVAFDAAKKHPLLLQIHGGPSAMWGPGEESMWFEFQYFAARGYALVFANPRGSGGYGFDFQRANYQNWGAGPASDILAAADFAAKESHVDPQRQVVTGGSYGGYMVAWIVGHDHRFAAAVAQRGVYDLLTFFGEGNAWRLVPRAFGGYPWQAETRRLLERESPLTYVESIKTPLLIQHGDNDRRTGFVQSEMLLRSLKVLGRDVESVRYPRASHEMSRSGEPKQRLDSLVRYEEFFRRYIGEN
ncbi:MAG: S9 family peptidase [Verrucomicrobia bacterium]|nr:S9 family peptidase [Verrucomicrobiota bacterium]